MSAALLNQYKTDLVIVKDTQPQEVKLEVDEVLVKIYSCGVCHTDVHAIDGDWEMKAKLPITPGHEGVGLVIQAGERSVYKVGARVGIPWLFSTCQNCEFCFNGWESLCVNQKCTGFTADGCLKEFVVAKAINCIPIPPELKFEQAAPLMCAGVTSYKGLKETEVKPGEFITIIGAAGGLGHLAIRYAKAMGMRVIAMDIGKEKLEYCTRLGAEFVVDATAADAHTQILSITKLGSHGVLCIAPHPTAFKTAVTITRPKGTTVLLGLPPKSFECPIVDVILHRKTIRGSIVGNRKDMQEALDFAARGLVKCDIELAKIDDINNIINRLRHEEIQGRVVVQFCKDDTLETNTKSGTSDIFMCKT